MYLYIQTAHIYIYIYILHNKHLFSTRYVFCYDIKYINKKNLGKETLLLRFLPIVKM